MASSETTSELVKKSLKKQLAVRALVKRREQEIVALERLIESARAKVNQESERCALKRTQLKESESELRSMAPTFAGIKEKQQRVRLQLIYLQKVRKKFDQVMKTLGEHEFKFRSRSSSGSLTQNASASSRLSRSHSTSNGHVTKCTFNKYSFHRSVSEGKNDKYSHKMHVLNEKIGQKKKELDGEIQSTEGLQAQVAAKNQELHDKSTRLTSLKAKLRASRRNDQEVLMISESFEEKLRLQSDSLQDGHMEATVHQLEAEHDRLCEDSQNLKKKLESKQRVVTDLEQLVSKLTNELEYLASRALKMDEKSEEEELACTERDMAGKNVKGVSNISDESEEDHEDPDDDDQLMMDYEDGCSLEGMIAGDSATALPPSDSPERRLNELKVSLQLSLEEKSREADTLKCTIEHLVAQVATANREAFENELLQLKQGLEKTEKEIKQSIATHRKIKLEAMAEKRLLALEAKKKQAKVEECKKACFEAQARIDENQHELQRLSSELHQLLTSCVPGYNSKVPPATDVATTAPTINIISDISCPSGKHGCPSSTNSKKLPHSDSPSKGETSSDRLSEPKVKRLRTTSASSSSRHKLSSSHPLSLGNLPSSMSKMYIEGKKSKSCSKKSQSKGTCGPSESASNMCTTSAASPPTSPELSVSRRSSSKESDGLSDDHTDECLWW